MAFDYADMQVVADDLIGEFGQAGAIRRSSTTAGPYDPDPVPTITDHPCTLVVTTYSQREREGSLIGTNDRKVLVATGGLDIVPSEADAVVVDGKTMQIVTVMPLAPGGLTVLYEIQARS